MGEGTNDDVFSSESLKRLSEPAFLRLWDFVEGWDASLFSLGLDCFFSVEVPGIIPDLPDGGVTFLIFLYWKITRCCSCLDRESFFLLSLCFIEIN